LILVEKIFEGVRQEGVNYGLPMVFIKLGYGSEYPTGEGLVREIVTKCKCKWVCIFGDNTTQVGMGTVIKGLASVSMNIEVECPGSIRDPGWFASVDRWLIDYAEEPLFNTGILRTFDMVRFIVNGEGDLNQLQQGFKSLKAFPGNKIVIIKNKSIAPAVFAFARDYDRVRLYLPNGVSK
jgi:hypothetical protein